MEVEKEENLKQEVPIEIIVLVIALVIASAVVYYLTAPLYREAKTDKLKIAAKEEVVKSKELLLERITRLNRSKKGGEEEESIRKLKKLIPNRNNYEDYLIHIAMLAEERNVVISQFSVSEGKQDLGGDSKGKTKLNKMMINFSAKGGYLSFISFLNAIEEGIPFIQVESVSVAGGGSEGSSEADPVLQYEVRTSFYYYKSK